MEEEQFTIEEIKNYLLSNDSLEDALEYISVDRIIEANEDDETFIWYNGWYYDEW